MTSRGQTISIDLNNVGSTLVPMYANGAGNDYHVRPACGRSPSPLCKFNLAFCLDPTVDNLLVTYNRSLEIGTSRERSFVAREGYDFYLDEVGNPCYWFKRKRQGYWLVSDFLSGDVVEKVVIFAKSHQINDIGIYLSILCGFVSKLPKAKEEWDYHIQEGASRQGGRFDQQLALNELFQSDLIYTAACHIGKCLDLKDGRRFLWETWDPFNCVFDCIYERNMQNYRRMQRNMALEGVPHNKHKEHLQSLSRLHKFMIRPRAPCTQHTAQTGPQPLLSLQIFIWSYIFLEGGKGVKERRLQNDQDSPKCQRFFMCLATVCSWRTRTPPT